MLQLVLLAFGAVAFALLAVVLSRERRRFIAVVLQKIPVAASTTAMAYPYDAYTPSWLLLVRDPDTEQPLEVETTPHVWGQADVGQSVVVTCDLLTCRARHVVGRDDDANAVAA